MFKVGVSGEEVELDSLELSQAVVTTDDSGQERVDIYVVIG
jgi:hypothetical protein